MRIIIDAMGGDNAPKAIVAGAIDAAREFGVDMILVGHGESILRCLNEIGLDNLPKGIEVANADDVVTMEDDPASVMREHRGSSMVLGLKMLAEGRGDAFISAGNTGALLTAATLTVKRIKGVRRAAFGPVVPTKGGSTVLIDCGANVDCTPEYLLQFGYMGSFYSSKVLGVENPRVGLLSNGSEDTKGTALCKEAHALLREAGEAGRLNFIGNVEGTDVFAGKADVIVADGFSGNIMLKTAEGTIQFLMKNIKGCLTASFSAKLGALLVKKNLGKLKKMMDVSEVGGTAFLGIQRPVIKAHGSSDARAVRSAVKQAIAFVQSGFTAEIENNIAYMRLRGEEQDK